MFSDWGRALILIKSFRPVFARVPQPFGAGGSDQIALEVDELKILGSVGSNVWGHTTDVGWCWDITDWRKKLADLHSGR